MAEGDVLAFPPFAAVYVRQVMVGRSGRLLIRPALTAAELCLYTQKRVVPPRFQEPNSLAETPGLSFGQELMEAVRPSNGFHVMAGEAGGTGEGLRDVVEWKFMGFQTENAKPKRKSSRR